MNIQELWEKIKLLFSEMWPILWPLIKKLMTDNAKLAMLMARKIVVNVQETMPNASGTEKVEAVLAQLMAALAAQGITMGIELLRTIIKVAYEEMIAEPEVIAEAKEMVDCLPAIKVSDPIVPEWVK